MVFDLIRKVCLQPLPQRCTICTKNLESTVSHNNIIVVLNPKFHRLLKHWNRFFKINYYYYFYHRKEERRREDLSDKIMGGKEQNFGLYVAFESLSLWHLQLLHTNFYRKLQQCSIAICSAWLSVKQSVLEHCFAATLIQAD